MNRSEIYHQVLKEDNLYSLAKKYNTTVEKIVKYNPYVDPNHLVIGSFVVIPAENNDNNNSLKENMRSVWEQHVYWTRLVIISIMERLQDEKEQTNRLLENAGDLAALYEPFYGKETANAIEKLITDHLVIASKLVHAIIDNKKVQAAELNREWYKNADDIVNALASINPNYNKDVLKQMFYEHLDLTKMEVLNRFNKDYKKEINTFDKIEAEAIMMADYLANGITKNMSM